MKCTECGQEKPRAFTPGTMVRGKRTGRLGVVITDFVRDQLKMATFGPNSVHVINLETGNGFVSAPESLEIVHGLIRITHVE